MKIVFWLGRCYCIYLGAVALMVMVSREGGAETTVDGVTFLAGFGLLPWLLFYFILDSIAKFFGNVVRGYRGKH